MGFLEIKCKVCEVLKEQLEYERARNKELTETITSLVKPVSIQTSNESGELKPIHSKFRTFTRRREELEKESRERAIKLNSPLAGKPDEERVLQDKPVNKLEHNPIVDQLEMELGIQSEVN